MILTLITLTGGRPEGFALCQQWMREQTYTGPVRWIIVDDCLPETEVGPMPPNWEVEVLRPESCWQPGQNTQARNMRLALSVIEEDANVVFIEDDDCYSPEWLEVVSRELMHHTLAGQLLSPKYNLATRRWRLRTNARMASLCCTAVRGRDLKRFRAIAEAGPKLMDVPLWRQSSGANLFAGQYVTSLKCVPGRAGLDSGHAIDFGTKDDPTGRLLSQWIGSERAKQYLSLIPAQAGATLAERRQEQHVAVKSYTPSAYTRLFQRHANVTPDPKQTDARKAEIEQYEKAYQLPEYRMGVRRKAHVEAIYKGLAPGSLLDVSTGRGEALELAKAAGHSPVKGTEAVEYLCDGENVVHALAHSLPFEDGQFDYVTCFDVLEHLLEEDLLPALKEFYRVARKAVIVSASEESDLREGRELHISKRPRGQWLYLIRQAWGQAADYAGTAGRSPAFKIEK